METEEGPVSDRMRRLWESYGMLHLPYRMMMVTKMLDRVTSAAIQREASLSLAQWRVIANLARLGHSTVNALAEHAHVDRAEVSRSVGALEALGLIQRDAHPASRVKKQLSLTPAGVAMAKQIGRDRRRFYEYLLANFDADEQRVFDRLLLRLAQRIEAYEPPGEAGEPNVPRAVGPATRANSRRARVDRPAG
ncbi:MarR family winged helix-turn-helix transcriptional regulator [Sphingomonas baiyangensis]|uniref:Winged helix-turn-helix transcriptional regulator n=1 Tax=Sphingomonas baiyangensis TaxID=2572576 RepID=A0A4U1L360_9SPHN|nr:MarR family winged helix-turn-helix transcriptional regulator [Sphingomonas baiyangensis]TKD50660.1 winged helix-turn-helix transcriptional regulator [Sphingomonas baiyangensis]